MRRKWTRRRRDQPKDTRRACLQLLADLDLPQVHSVAALVQVLGDRRGRPIALVPIDVPPSYPCGAWVSARDHDVIFFDARTTTVHQEHIILHELGHIICCHRGAGELDDETAQQLFPNLDPSIVRDMLRRATYHDTQEREAEIMAYVLMEHLSRPSVAVVDVQADDDLGRVSRTLA